MNKFTEDFLKDMRCGICNMQNKMQIFVQHEEYDIYHRFKEKRKKVTIDYLYNNYINLSDNSFFVIKCRTCLFRVMFRNNTDSISCIYMEYSLLKEKKLINSVTRAMSNNTYTIHYFFNPSCIKKEYTIENYSEFHTKNYLKKLIENSIFE